MKQTFTKLAAVSLLAAAPVALHAQQARTIVYGRTVITFNPAFLQLLASSGVTLTDLSQNPLQGGVNTLVALEGSFDLQSGNGEVIFAGGYQVTGGGQTIRAQDLAFQIPDQTGATLTGIFTTNGTVVGQRQAVFIVNRAPTYTLPIPSQNGTITLPTFSLGLSSTFTNLINTAMGQQAINPGVIIGTADVYDVFAATN